MTKIDVAPALSLAQRYEQIVLDNPIEQLLAWGKEAELIEVKDEADMLLLISLMDVSEKEALIRFYPPWNTSKELEWYMFAKDFHKNNKQVKMTIISDWVKFAKECLEKGKLYALKLGEQK